MASTAPADAGAAPSPPDAGPLDARPPVERIVAIGDVHGDLEGFRAALRLGGLIGDGDAWTGGKTVGVQLGDLLDRGDEERAIIDLLAQLGAEARAAGGDLLAVNGNHELMNAAGDFRYVTRGGFADFADLAAEAPDARRLLGYPAARRGRIAALSPGGPYARKLAVYPVILTVGDNVFVHGGVLPKHVDYGVERINREARDYLLHGDETAYLYNLPWDSPVNSRHYADRPGSGDCYLLDQTLKAMGKRRMVVGHTQHPAGTGSYCKAQVWAIDVGLSRWGGGHREVLEIEGEHVRVLKGPDVR